MSFTDRFIKIPVELFNLKEAEMLGFNEQTKITDSFIYTLPMEISSFRATKSDVDNEVEHTLIYMKNGESFYAAMSIEKFQEFLNDKMDEKFNS